MVQGAPPARRAGASPVTNVFGAEPGSPPRTLARWGGEDGWGKPSTGPAFGINGGERWIRLTRSRFPRGFPGASTFDAHACALHVCRPADHGDGPPDTGTDPGPPLPGLSRCHGWGSSAWKVGTTSAVGVNLFLRRCRKTGRGGAEILLFDREYIELSHDALAF